MKKLNYILDNNNNKILVLFSLKFIISQVLLIILILLNITRIVRTHVYKKENFLFSVILIRRKKKRFKQRNFVLLICFVCKQTNFLYFDQKSANSWNEIKQSLGKKCNVVSTIDKDIYFCLKACVWSILHVPECCHPL